MSLCKWWWCVLLAVPIFPVRSLAAQDKTMVSLAAGAAADALPVYGDVIAAALNSASPTPDIGVRNTSGCAVKTPAAVDRLSGLAP